MAVVGERPSATGYQDSASVAYPFQAVALFYLTLPTRFAFLISAGRLGG